MNEILQFIVGGMFGMVAGSILTIIIFISQRK